MICPYGFLYFEFDKNKKYSARKGQVKINTKESFIIPITKTFNISKNPKLAVVMG